VSVVYPCPAISPNVKPADVEAMRQRLGLSGKKVLLTLGRVVERKGYDTVIKAMPEISKHVPEAVYVVAGVGSYLGKLGKMVEDMKLQSAVRFVGSVSDEERAAYFYLCDLFVMPSRQIGPDVEGFGIVYLEAAMFGKPSIGGNSGGVPEAILDSKTGALVDPSDADALARVVVQLLRDDAVRHELGQNAKARALYEFRWERQVEGLIFALK
jgi:phosphatidyl-myo-inositol dimannoside synthase